MHLVKFLKRLFRLLRDPATVAPTPAVPVIPDRDKQAVQAIARLTAAPAYTTEQCQTITYAKAC
jgi:hypothetical protein